MNLWVDDQKPLSHGLTDADTAIARTYDDAVRMMRRFEYDALYLDFDLGDEMGRTGLDLLREVHREGRCPPVVHIISLNVVGRGQLQAELDDYACEDLAAEHQRLKDAVVASAKWFAGEPVQMSITEGESNLYKALSTLAAFEAQHPEVK